MKPRRFLISTLLMAGFLPPHTASAIPADPTFDRPSNKSTLFDIFKRDHIFDLSRHSSHRSHSSHSSHSSHRSSNGGGYSAPVYTPPRVYTHRRCTPPRRHSPRQQHERFPSHRHQRPPCCRGPPTSLRTSCGRSKLPSMCTAIIRGRLTVWWGHRRRSRFQLCRSSMACLSPERSRLTCSMRCR